MNYCLYILCEGERDEMFFELLAERVTGMTFQRPTDFRLRRGANWKSAMANARMLMSYVKRWQGSQDIGVIIAVDNDRAPQHPASPVYPRTLSRSDQNKAPRFNALVQMVEDALGTDRTLRTVDVALAVPVEMIESWVLTLLDPSRATLPIFAEAKQATARHYHAGHAPPQLKDLCHLARSADESMDELFWRATEQDIEAAAVASPSLRMFIAELKDWPSSADDC